MNKRLKALIDKSSIVSFDIYDTLLFRACGRPEKVFEMVAEKNGINQSDFCNSRIGAEKFVREASQKKEICLEDIYKDNTLNEKFDSNELMKSEKYIEENIVYANREMFEVFQYAVKHKRVILISDMYLDDSTIKKALQNAGIRGYSKLYLSSEVGLKKSKGELFYHVIKMEKTKPDKILHIGDNIISDYIRPAKYGIKTYLYCQHKKYHSLKKPYINSALIENETLNKSKYYDFGYKYLGPALFGYVSWMKDDLKKKDISKVFFLAREGQLIKKAFDIVKGIDKFEESYIYASRRSLAVPAIATTSNVEEFIHLRPIYSRVKVRDQFEKVGLCEDDFANKRWFTDCKDKTFGNLSKKERDEIINDLYQESKKVAILELELLGKYLIQEGFDGKCAVVDLGWNGSMQRSIVEITQYFNMDTEIIGYFLAQRDEYYKNQDYITNYGYLFDYGKVTEQENLLLNSGTNLLEILFTADHATTIKYRDEHGTVVPILGEYEYATFYPRIKECQDAALKYIKDNVNRRDTLSDIYEYDYKSYFNNMYEMLKNPDLQIIELFGDINYSDLNEKEMYLARKISLFSISSFIREFKYSGWKVGFLKRNLKTKKSFLIYCFLRKRFN